MTRLAVNTPKIEDFLKGKYDILIPTSIFFDRRISILEAIVEYLKEEHKLKFVQIATLMNRDARNISTAYYRAKDKRIERIKVKQTVALFPLSVVKDRSKSIFESIVYSLRELGVSNKTISLVFNRSTKTISTVYSRAKKK